MKVTENFKWKQLKYGVTKSFHVPAPQTEHCTMSQGHVSLFSNDLVSICSVKHLYKSQNVNAVYPIMVLFTHKEIGAYTGSFATALSPWSRFPFSWLLLMLLDESY